MRLIGVVIVLQLLARDGLALQGTPGIEDIRQHEGDEDGHVRHHFQREGAGAAVGDGERALQVCH